MSILLRGFDPGLLRGRLRAWALGFVGLTVVVAACDPFYDEGARFSNALSAFATRLQDSSRDEDVFVYSPKYGVDQEYSVDLSVGRCLATVEVAKGLSGNGYACGRNVSVPKRLFIKKQRAPVSISLRKRAGTIEATAIR